MARGEKTLGWRVLAALVIPAMNVLGRYEFRGLERIPASAVVVSPNHYSNIDPLVTAYAVGGPGASALPREGEPVPPPVAGAVLRATGQILAAARARGGRRGRRGGCRGRARAALGRYRPPTTASS